MNQQRMTAKETAEYLGVHIDTIYTAVRENQLPHLKVRSKIIFFRETLDTWIEEQLKLPKQ